MHHSTFSGSHGILRGCCSILMGATLFTPVSALAAPSSASATRPAMAPEEIAAALATMRAQLTGPFEVRPHCRLGPETPLSRDVYQRLLRYVHLTNPRFHDWPGAAGCRYHKEDGDTEYPVRQNADVALGYSVLLAGTYDEKTAGVPRERIEADLRGMLRYLGITHRANFLPAGTGKQWGDHWQSAFWAAIAGQAAWLAWDVLDDDTRIMMARVIVDEADRFNTRPPDSGWEKDTKAEENAWNSEIIALAACMFPRHERAPLWRERAIVYMINSFVREQDRSLGRIVDGHPARERLQATTLYSDFSLANHNRVHPDYMTTVSLVLRNALFYRAAGVPVPDSTFFNVPEVFALVKSLASTNGSLFYINGQDWWPHRQEVLLMVTSQMSVLKHDPEAAFLERAALDFLGRMHTRFTDGSAWAPREYRYRHAEEELVARYAELYLLHRMFGDGAEPVTRDEYVHRQGGTHLQEAGGFVTHRTPEKFVSFAWGQGAMGLVYPGDDTWFTSPSELGMVGRIAISGAKEKNPTVTAHQVGALADGLAVAARIDRCDGRIKQDVAIFSLQRAPVIWLERLTAADDVDVDRIETGLLVILNEDAGVLHANRRTIHHESGHDEVVGASDAPDRLLAWKTSWVNVDGRFGVICTGNDGQMAYRDANEYARCRLDEELIPNYRPGVGHVSKGQILSTCAVAYLPRVSTEETSKARLELQAASGGIVAARLGGTIVAVNFGRSPDSSLLFGQQVSLPPLNSVITPK